jgi:monofunctional biosynthetic peptidoglycan transglycosylase
VIAFYRFVNPPFSTLMISTAFAGKAVTTEWVPIERISRNLVAAVVASEDARFCQHWGVDWGAVEDVLEEVQEGGAPPRGASTIPMQTAKNLFLWHERSYVRKALEIPAAYAITALWPKRRVVEVYLNIVEWAPGVFGAQAAARHHFNTTADRLTLHQAALLAAALPNPHERNAGRPGPVTRSLAQRIVRRVRGGGTPLACIGAEG